MSLEVFSLGREFFHVFVRYMLVRPYLAMRMGITRAHHGPPVFEYLDSVDEGQRSKLKILFDPDVDDLAYVGKVNARNSQIMTRGETDHTAHPALTLSNEETRLVELLIRCVG